MPPYESTCSVLVCPAHSEEVAPFSKPSERKSVCPLPCVTDTELLVDRKTAASPTVMSTDGAVTKKGNPYLWEETTNTAVWCKYGNRSTTYYPSNRPKLFSTPT